MRKLGLFLIMVMLSASGFCANEWRYDGTENTILGSENASDIDSASFQNIVDPLDRVLADYRTVRLAYSSATTLTIKSGAIVCQNSDSSGSKMRFNTSDLSVAWTDIDTGSEANSTTYYVYAVADADAETFTALISASSSAPTGATFYKRIGSFYNDSNGNITLINNDKLYGEYGSFETKSNNVAYQATSDGIVVVYLNITDGGAGKYRVTGYTDSSSSPSTTVCATSFTYTPDSTTTEELGFSFPVKSGDYYKVYGRTISGAIGSSSLTIRFLPTQ